MEGVTGNRTCNGRVILQSEMKRTGTYALLAVTLIGAAAALWFASNKHFVALEHIPTEDATLLSIDFNTLRKAGLLSLLATSGAEEPEYLSFIRATGFDYQKDLDSALVSFAPQATYFLIHGHFNWKQLENYAKTNGGGCYEKLCHLPGSTPQRRISFLPLQNDLMAMAVAADDLAATRLRDQNASPAMKAPRDPVWMSVPSAALKRTSEMSASTRLFASAVSGADRVTIALGSNGAGYAARLEANCNSTKDAQTVTAQLSKITSALKAAPVSASSQNDLAGVLIAGTFQQSDRKVFGYWPISKGLLQNLTGGM